MMYMVPAVRVDAFVETESRTVRDYLRFARMWYLGQAFRLAVMHAVSRMVELWAEMTHDERAETDRLLAEVL